MIHKSLKKLISFSHAPMFCGVFFFFGIAATVSCQKKSSTDFSSSLPKVEDVASTNPSSKATKSPSLPSTADSGSSKKVSKTSTPAGASIGLRFTAYNVANWLIMDDRFDFEANKTTKNAPKPADEKAAVIEILLSTQPDVIGLCEIGTGENLSEIQQHLKSKGLDLPHAHFSGGIDQSRRLGLLSKFPIIATAKPDKLDYVLSGKAYSMQRGILDASVKSPDERVWRFLGVHLKSKREVDDGDQNLMRINEAQLLRRHIDGIQKQDPQARLVCYGDFNDTRRSSPLRIVQGVSNSPSYMVALPLKDTRGESWTQYWEREDVYSRFDYILHSHSLKEDIIPNECCIIDLPNWRKASDHRAIKATFR